MLKRGLFLSLFISICACQQEPQNSEINWKTNHQQISQKAIDYLWSQQSEDGGWHSQTHGIMKGGQAYTPYIFDALLNADDSLIYKGNRNYIAATNFILRSMDTASVIGRNGIVMEYPVYATAYAQRTIVKSLLEFDTILASKMATYLLKQQFTEQRGISPEHPAYGAWGFGETNLQKGQAGHVDLSHTRRVLETLQIMGFPKDNPVILKAQIFLSRLQKQNQTTNDGGFCASTHTFGTNKADGNENQCQSYASATADGVLAMLAAGYSLDHPQIKAAEEWLLDHEKWNYVSGIPDDMDGNWGEVLFFYHIAVRAQAYQKLGIDNGWQIKVLQILQTEQKADGSFLNPAGAANKEDDPLLATALVLRALNAMEL